MNTGNITVAQLTAVAFIMTNANDTHATVPVSISGISITSIVSTS